MYEKAEKPKVNKSRAVANSVAQKKSNVNQGFWFVDNRPARSVQRKSIGLLEEAKSIIQLQGLGVNKGPNLNGNGTLSVVQLISAQIGKKTYSGDKSLHAEEAVFKDSKNKSGNLIVYIDAWPCTGEHKGHNCHDLYTNQSADRIIVVNVTADSGGYAANHGYTPGSTGKMTYFNGVCNIVLQTGQTLAAAAAATPVIDPLVARSLTNARNNKGGAWYPPRKGD